MLGRLPSEAEAAALSASAASGSDLVRAPLLEADASAVQAQVDLVEVLPVPVELLDAANLRFRRLQPSTVESAGPRARTFATVADLLFSLQSHEDRTKRSLRKDHDSSALEHQHRHRS